MDEGVDARVVELRRGDLRITVAGGSCVGNRYAANFDVWHLAPDRLLAVVADGMGDGRGSAVAGRTAVETFVAGVSASVVGPAPLRTAVAEAQRLVCAAGSRLGELTGCTMTALVGDDADPSDAWLVHIGDSRVYRLRDGSVELLTADHTVAWLGALYGWFPVDSPEAFMARHQLVRFVGHPAMPEPDILNVTLRPGDVYCLCTDGVAEQVPYQRLVELLGSDLPTGQVVEALLADTLAAGGRDNATLVLLRVGSA